METIYVASGEFYSRQLPAQPNSTEYTDQGVRQLAADIGAWETSSARWIAMHMGEAARDRFLEPSSSPSFIWHSQSNFEYNEAMNQLAWDRKNLSVIIEFGAYYGE